MIKIKTSEATPLQLNWLVATCEGYRIVDMRDDRITFLDPEDDGALNSVSVNYSTDWSQGGPIIEREQIALDWHPNGLCHACIDLGEGDAMVEVQTGPTPLIAAMRCVVASKLGDEVEIPEELL